MSDARYNGHVVSGPMAELLGRVQSYLVEHIGIAAATHVKGTCTQGQAGTSTFSGGTHASGDAVDYLTATLPPVHIKVLVEAFQKNGGQAVLRLSGDPVGPGGSPIGPEHVHAVRDGESNAAAIKAVTGPRGRWAIERQLKRRAERAVRPTGTPRRTLTWGPLESS